MPVPAPHWAVGRTVPWAGCWACPASFPSSGVGTVPTGSVAGTCPSCCSWSDPRGPDRVCAPCPWGWGGAGAFRRNPGDCTGEVGFLDPSETHKKTHIRLLVKLTIVSLYQHSSSKPFTNQPIKLFLVQYSNWKKCSYFYFTFGVYSWFLTINQYELYK